MGEKLLPLIFLIKVVKYIRYQISFTKTFYDSREYLSKDLEQIPIEERFIYQYLKDKRANQTEEEASDAESVTSEDFNEALDNIKHDDVDFASNVNDAELEKSDSEDEEMELDGEVNLTSLIQAAFDLVNF